MSTFKSLVKVGLLTGNEKCNLRDVKNPDGCWDLQESNLALGHLLCVEYEAALEDLPKLIIDSFINKYGKKPDGEEFADIIKTVAESMKIAIHQGRVI